MKLNKTEIIELIKMRGGITRVAEKLYGKSWQKESKVKLRKIIMDRYDSYIYPIEAYAYGGVKVDN